MSEGKPRRLVWLDCETTGVDPYTDRIIELGLVEEDAAPLRLLVNPGVPIPQEATAVHGISDEDVAGAPGFETFAEMVQGVLSGPDVVFCGYNSASFDVCLIDAELRRAGQPGLDLSRKRDVDVLRVWKALEERTLEAAVLRWLGRSHDGAHGAVADAEASREVLEAMGVTLEEALELTFPPGALDRAGKFVIGEESGLVELAFGRNKGRRAVEVPDYLEWMLGKDFAPDTKAIARRALGWARRG